MFGSWDGKNPEKGSNAGSSYIQTPYLNIDPNYLSGGDEYILLEDAGPVRSRVQVMFAIVGTAAVTGAVLGGLESIRYMGIQMFTGKASRMEATSSILKNGGRFASKLGSIAFLYCTCSVICEKTRGVEDELNTVFGGGAAGALYSIPSVFNVSKHTAEEIDKLGFFRRNFMRLPPLGRFLTCSGLGLIAGGLLGIYKNQASSYIKEITSKT